MTIVNWSTEKAIAQMGHRGWIERSRETIPAEGRVLVRLAHPRQSVGQGADRSTGPVETFRSLALSAPPERQLALFGSPVVAEQKRTVSR